MGDADSAITIGAVNINRQVAGFSSYGPNSDGQIKPDVAAVGSSAVIANAGNGQPTFGNGTSYACPIMAGITTCLWQAFPEINNMDLIDGLRQSGDRFDNPNDRTGYGVPDVKKAFVFFIKSLHTQSAIISNCNAVFNFNMKAADGMQVVIERKLPSDTGYVAITTQNFNGSFASRLFSYTDSLGAYTSGVVIQYRIQMNIGADTSFYLDSVTLSYNGPCAPVTERKICPGAATYFSVDTLPGYSYQWQADMGEGFTDITNNSFYNGVSSTVLILNNLPQNFYGYKYRCMQTNGSTTLYSTPVTLKFASAWTGTYSSSWENSGNWRCGIVPTQYIDVTIPGGISNYPVVNSNAACHALATLPGASVVVNNGFKLDIVGH